MVLELFVCHFVHEKIDSVCFCLDRSFINNSKAGEPATFVVYPLSFKFSRRFYNLKGLPFL